MLGNDSIWKDGLIFSEGNYLGNDRHWQDFRKNMDHHLLFHIFLLNNHINFAYNLSNKPSLITFLDLCQIHHCTIQHNLNILTSYLIRVFLPMEQLQRIRQKSHHSMHQQPNKYSIKIKLQQQLTLHHHPSSTLPTPTLSPANNFQTDHQIYMPEYHNYFLHTIEKEIKHEGNLLKRIRRKIDDFKQQQVEKKRIKNAKHYYSHLMFNSTPFRSRKNNSNKPNPSSTITSTPKADLHPTFACTAATSTRQTEKTKTNSFSNKPRSALRVKTASPSKELSTHQPSKIFVPSRSSFFSENELIQKFGKLVKHTKKFDPLKKDDFSVRGERPQWDKFQSYHNGSNYLARKCNE